jgi:diaminopimelate epimerase
MTIDFYKYQGTGNDFIILDNRKKDIILTAKQIAQLCDRRFGVGADGLMLLQNHSELDFEMRYFNADGAEGSMCGNGGRCLVSFAHRIGVCSESTNFMAVDGPHKANFTNDGTVELKMLDVLKVSRTLNGFFLDTGSPHFVKFVDDIENYDVSRKGKEFRYHEIFAPTGCNANFVEEISSDTIKVRTYERGVENETLSCGTGVVASALANFLKNKTGKKEYYIQTLGGKLTVRFSVLKKDDLFVFENIWLCGAAQFVFTGSIEL